MKIEKILFLMLLLKTSISICQEKSSNLKVSGIALPNKSPESGWSIQGGAIGIFKTDPKDTLMRSSNIYLFGMYSQFKQYRISNGGEIFTPKEKYYINYWLYYSYLPDKFYGTLVNSNFNKYQFIYKNVLFSNVVLLKKIKDKQFAGIDFTYERSFNFKTDTAGLYDNSEPFNQFKNYNYFALGAKYQYDSRNAVINTQTGKYLSLLFKPSIVNQHTSFQVSVDARKYLPFKKNTFSFQLFTEKLFGNAPINMLPYLNLRAFHPNQYKGDFCSYIQAEQRWHLKPWLFLSTFEGSGLVDSKNNWKWESNYGAGLRIRMVKAYNLFMRVEYGFGTEGSNNLYLAFYEAF